jgi:hypothetical protein
MNVLEQDGYVYPGKRFTQTGLMSGVGQGMTLRDYFAGQALPAVISACQHDTLVKGEIPEEVFARIAFEVADAMIKARDTATKEQAND